MEFPKWKYHAKNPATVVEDAEAEAALGEAWFDTPAEAGEGAEPDGYSDEDRQALFAKAVALGLSPRSNARAETVALAIAAKEAENAGTNTDLV